MLEAKRGGLYRLYPAELYFSYDLSTDEQIVQDRDVPPEILRLRNIILDRLSHINFDKMRVKGEIYTVIKRLPGWNVALLPDGRYGLFAASLDDRY